MRNYSVVVLGRKNGPLGLEISGEARFDDLTKGFEILDGDREVYKYKFKNREFTDKERSAKLEYLFEDDEDPIIEAEKLGPDDEKHVRLSSEMSTTSSPSMSTRSVTLPPVPASSSAVKMNASMSDSKGSAASRLSLSKPVGLSRENPTRPAALESKQDSKDRDVKIGSREWWVERLRKAINDFPKDLRQLKAHRDEAPDNEKIPHMYADALRVIAQCLSDYKVLKLSELNITSFKTKDVLLILTYALQWQQKITTLDLSVRRGPYLTWGQIRDLLGAVARSPLTNLNLEGNDLEGIDVQEISKVLNGLIELNLNNTNLSTKALQNIGKVLENNKQLKILKLGKNRHDESTYASFAKFLKKSTTIVEIDLSHCDANNLSEWAEESEEMAEALEESYSLTSFTLVTSDNMTQDIVDHSIARNTILNQVFKHLGLNAHAEINDAKEWAEKILKPGKSELAEKIFTRGWFEKILSTKVKNFQKTIKPTLTTYLLCKQISQKNNLAGIDLTILANKELATLNKLITEEIRSAKPQYKAYLERIMADINGLNRLEQTARLPVATTDTGSSSKAEGTPATQQQPAAKIDAKEGPFAAYSSSSTVRGTPKIKNSSDRVEAPTDHLDRQSATETDDEGASLLVPSSSTVRGTLKKNNSSDRVEAPTDHLDQQSAAETDDEGASLLVPSSSTVRGKNSSNQVRLPLKHEAADEIDDEQAFLLRPFSS